MKKPTCFDCTSASIYCGSRGDMYSPPEPDIAICNYQEVIDRLDAGEDDVENPEKCGLFEPLLADNCAHCKAPINKPYHEWKLWSNGGFGEPVPCCSDKCAAAITLLEIEEMWMLSQEPLIK